TSKTERDMAKTIHRLFRILEKLQPKRQRRITRMSVNQIVRCYIRRHGPHGAPMPKLELPELVGHRSLAAAFARAAADIERQLLRPALDEVPGINPADYSVVWSPGAEFITPRQCGHCGADRVLEPMSG